MRSAGLAVLSHHATPSRKQRGRSDPRPGGAPAAWHQGAGVRGDPEQAPRHRLPGVRGGAARHDEITVTLGTLTDSVLVLYALRTFRWAVAL